RRNRKPLPLRTEGLTWPQRVLPLCAHLFQPKRANAHRAEGSSLLMRLSRFGRAAAIVISWQSHCQVIHSRSTHSRCPYMPQCEGTSKKTGERCTAPTAKGGTLCAGHAGMGKLDAGVAAAKSAEVRAAKANERKMSALDHLSAALEANSKVFAAAL